MSARGNKVALKSAAITPGLRFVCAVFDFTPSVPEELCFKVGDVVKVLEKVDDFWLKGLKLVDGKSGQFPHDFVKEIVLPKHSANETLLYALDTFYPEAAGDLQFDKGDIIVVERKVNNEWGTGRCNSKRGMFPLNYTERLLPLTIASFQNDSRKKDVNPPKAENVSSPNIDCGDGLGIVKATMNLTAQLEEELSFCVGDEIIVTEVLEDGLWFKGRLGSHVGTFPASFVQILTPLKVTKSTRPPNSMRVQLSRTGSKDWKEEIETAPNNITSNNNKGSHNEISRDVNMVKDLTENSVLNMPAEYRSTEGHQHDKNPGATTESTIVTDNSILKKTLYTVTAMHKFTGNTEQELSFEKEVEIPIFEEVDDHWLMGKVGEKEGYVPRAYVSKKASKDNTNTPKKEATNASAKDNVDNAETMENRNYVKMTGNRLVNKHHVYTAPRTPDSHSLCNHSDSNQQRLKKGTVIYDYHAKNQFDLTLLKGDTVYVLREVDNKWIEVMNDSNQKGIIPSSYIKVASDGDAPTSKPHPSRTQLNSAGRHDNDENRTVRGDAPNVPSPQNDSYPFSHTHPTYTTMPVLHEHAVSDGGVLSAIRDDEVNRQFAFSSPKPYIAQKPKTLQTNLGRKNQSHVLQKSISVDSAAKSDQPHQNNVSRSNSNPQYQNSIKARDAKPHLKAWQQSRKLNSPDSPSTTPNETAAIKVESGYKVPVLKKSHFSRVTNRSASMREKRTQRRYDEDVTSEDNAFVKIKSDSDLSVNAVIGKQRPRSGAGEKSKESHGSDRTSGKNRTSVKNPPSAKSWQLDSASTTSTGSSSSYGESRASYSTHSDVSSSEVSSSTSRKSGSSERVLLRSAPPVPPHAQDLVATLSELNQNSTPYVPSPWSPPVPQRKQSLQHEARKRTDDEMYSSPELSHSPKTAYLIPVRPAPKLPPPRGLTRQRPATLSGPISPQKKVPPMRPANPPHARHHSPQARGQERVRSIASRETKDRMEKLRSDIEDYSRMMRDLENLYQGTLDGKERREISENRKFVQANLRRLQKEFHDVIEGQQDHIYESIEQHMRPRPVVDGSNSFERLPAPPLPPLPDSPGSVRKKRIEKRLLVITELINTERDFLIDVTVTVEDIMDELVDRQISPSTISTLFANVVQVRDFSESFLKELEEALQNETSSPTDPEELTIGQVFIDNNPEMKEVYMPYYRNHDDAMNLLEKLQDDQEFMQAVSVCLDAIKNKVNVFDLGSFLIKPVQRFLKYPLLIEELIKLTDRSTADNPTDHDKLILAHKMMQSLAKDINEDKRIKDLVRKYKDGGNEGLSEKLGKISIKSLKKKSTRISQKIGRAAGITTQETKDAQFDEVEKRFKIMERAAKMFVSNISTYCDKCRDVLCAELVVAHTIVDMVIVPDSTHPVAEYQSTAEKMSGPLYRQFHDHVQLRVLSPITSLVNSFKSPQAIIAKRLDKLIDYERSLKHSDSKEKIEAARHDYEALNKSLLDELPKLCDLGLKLLSSCTAIFARVHRDFETNLLNVLKPLLAKIQGSSSDESRIPSNMETYERFHPAYAEAIHTISRLQVVPASFGTLFGSTKGSTETQRKSRSLQGAKQLESSPTLSKKQPPDDRQALLQKYQPQQLFVAEKNYSLSQLMDIGCCEGDLVAVLKQQDPMGSRERWFVNKGGTGTCTGFLPSSILRPYDPLRDDSLMSFSPPQAASPTPTSGTPTPAPRQKSPTPSSRSGSSADSASSGSKAPLSPYSLRETLKRGTLPNKQDGSPIQLTDSDILDVFKEEDEIFDDTEYGEVPSTGTSPKSTRQHFRAEYEFAARSDLELTVRTGSIVKLILAHDTDGNSEWWLVSNSEGKQGYVPSNYLTRAEYL